MNKPDLTLKPLKLHELLAGQTIWTDDLWNETFKYLTAHVVAIEAMDMTKMLNGTVSYRPSEYFSSRNLRKLDHLNHFHKFPPTILLGIYDMMRRRRVLDKIV